MSRRVPDLEHACADCGTWTEVWDDGDPGELWISCACDGGSAPIALVKRLARECVWTGAPS